MPSDYWTASDYLATIASDYPATIGYIRGRGSLGGAAPVFVPWGRVWRAWLDAASGINAADALAFAQKCPLNRFYCYGREKYHRKQKPVRTL